MIKRSLPSAMILACIALLVALVGTSYAATQHGETQASISKKHKVKRGPKGKRGAQGPKGATGPQGPAGPAGAAGKSATTLWAVVESDGTLARGSGVTKTDQPFGTGTYEVVFNQDVFNCAYLTGLGDGGDTGAEYKGNVAVTHRDGNRNAVFVRAFDATGTLADQPFHMAVFC
jgi:hypothetical protein